MAENQKIHSTKQLHPLFVLGGLVFFFGIVYVLFGQQSKTLERQEDSIARTVTSSREPRFDREPQDRVGPFRYTSEFLKISFDVPEGYRVEEKLTTIELSKSSSLEDNIKIERLSSNAKNLNDYFSNFRKYKYELIEEKNIENRYNYEAIFKNEMSNFGDVRIAIYIYHKPYTIFVISGTQAQSVQKLIDIVSNFQ